MLPIGLSKGLVLSSLASISSEPPRDCHAQRRRGTRDELRDRPTGTGSESPRETSEHLSETLTLLEAAALTNTDPDALWERIRSTGIPFTLVSGRRDRGASVLVNTGDLVGAGL